MLGVISLACGQSLPEMLIIDGSIVMRLHRYESDNTAALAALALAGIDHVQGYVVSRPVGEDQLLQVDSAVDLIQDPKVAEFVRNFARMRLAGSPDADSPTCVPAKTIWTSVPAGRRDAASASPAASASAAVSLNSVAAAPNSRATSTWVHPRSRWPFATTSQNSAGSGMAQNVSARPSAGMNRGCTTAFSAASSPARPASA
jgi:hypothetical protein